MGNPLGLAPRRVTAQGEHVVDTRVADLAEDLDQALGRLADAGEVSHRLDLEVLLDPLRDLDRALASRAGGAVSHGDVVRVVGPEHFERVLQHAAAVVGLRREELEGEAGLAGRDDLVDAH